MGHSGPCSFVFMYSENLEVVFQRIRKLNENKRLKPSNAQLSIFQYMKFCPWKRMYCIHSFGEILGRVVNNMILTMMVKALLTWNSSIDSNTFQHVNLLVTAIWSKHAFLKVYMQSSPELSHVSTWRKRWEVGADYLNCPFSDMKGVLLIMLGFSVRMGCKNLRIAEFGS